MTARCAVRVGDDQGASSAATESLKVPQSVSVFNAEGPPVPIPNTEVKLCSADDTCLATGRENRSMLTQTLRVKMSGENFRRVGDSNAEGPPVPIPNTEVKLCSAENTYLATGRENRSLPTLWAKFNQLGPILYLPT